MTLLDPERRSLYVDVLRPPPGMVFDRGLATTYSLDLETLLALPLHLVLYAGESSHEELLHEGVALLDALRRTTRRLTVYLDRGRIIAPRAHRVLFSLLEPMIREVDLRERGLGHGAFHPKVWLLRFRDPEDHGEVAYRLAVLTRNVTADLSWDVGLRLDGRPGAEPVATNGTLVRFLRSLPRLAGGTLAEEVGGLDAEFLDEVARVDWDVPEGFRALRFHHLRPGADPWRPPVSDRLAVVSPFCGGRALEALVGTTGEARALVTRPETLARIPADVRARFGGCLVLGDRAETEDGEDVEAPAHARGAGLHAKLYLMERGRELRLVLGSANATDAALVWNLNVEFMVELEGRRGPGLSIDDLLGPEGMGELLMDGALLDLDEERAEAEDAMDRLLESARDVARGSGLVLRCQEVEGLWHLTLEAPAAVAWPEGVAVRTWPVTVPVAHARDAGPLREGGPLVLGDYSVQSVTSLVAFEVAAAAGSVDDRIRFVLNLPVEGLPEAQRKAALTRQIISNEESFLRYLLLLLGDLDVETGRSELLGTLGVDNPEGVAFEDLPILEEMARAYCRAPERLRDIEELIERLGAEVNGDGGEDVIPADFRDLWATFQEALGVEGRRGDVAFEHGPDAERRS